MGMKKILKYISHGNCDEGTETGFSSQCLLILGKFGSS